MATISYAKENICFTDSITSKVDNYIESLVKKSKDSTALEKSHVRLKYAELKDLQKAFTLKDREIENLKTNLHTQEALYKPYEELSRTDIGVFDIKWDLDMKDKAYYLQTHYMTILKVIDLKEVTAEINNNIAEIERLVGSERVKEILKERHTPLIERAINLTNEIDELSTDSTGTPSSFSQEQKQYYLNLKSTISNILEKYIY